ncbi:MAG: hypothetical protein HY300_18650 [Verrucomicrobia bacterium]|nr:hypothetical protein [Verrucomicrobiota bacterium]
MSCDPKRKLVLLASALLALSGGDSFAAAAPDFNQHIAPIFRMHCLDCHAANDPEKNLVLESYESLMKGGENGKVVAPGNSAESLLVKFLEGRSGKTGKNQFMPPGKRDKLSATDIAAVKAWIDDGAKPPTAALTLAPRELKTPKIEPKVPPRRAIHALAFAPGPNVIAVARYGEVELLDAATREVKQTLRGHRGHVNAVAFSKDGKLLASAAGEPGLFGEVKLWNVADGTLLRTIEGHGDALYSVAISPDGKLLATGSYDQKIKLWSVDTGSELKTLSGHNGCIFGLAFRPDGKILASASADRTVKLWDAATGERRDTLTQPLKEQYAVAFSPDGKRLVAGGVDSRIRVWAISERAAETTNPILESKFAHEGPILSLVFSQDGKTLVSSAEDRTVKLWDAATMTEKLLLEPQPDLAPGLTFLAAGQTVAVGRLDGTLGFYSAASGKGSN